MAKYIRRSLHLSRLSWNLFVHDQCSIWSTRHWALLACLFGTRSLVDTVVSSTYLHLNLLFRAPWIWPQVIIMIIWQFEVVQFNNSLVITCNDYQKSLSTTMQKFKFIINGSNLHRYKGDLMCVKMSLSINMWINKKPSRNFARGNICIAICLGRKAVLILVTTIYILPSPISKML